MPTRIRRTQSDETAPAPAVKPGYQTTEFWLTVLAHAMPIIALVMRQDFTAQTQSAALGAAAVANISYNLSRSRTKIAALAAELTSQQ